MFQKVTIIGALGGDPEKKELQGGSVVTNFSVATTTQVSKKKQANCPKGWKESYNKKNWELTTWWKVACWGEGLANFAADYLFKGGKVYIEGEVAGTAVDGTLNPTIWKTSENKPAANYQLTARLIKPLEWKERGSSSRQDDDQEEDVDEWDF